MRDIPPPDNSALFTFLQSRPQPVMETELLREFFPGSREALAAGVSLELFRYHFILYHSLYRLAEELEHSNSDYILYIKTINVYLLKKPPAGYCRYFEESVPGFCGVKTGIAELYCPFHRDLNDRHRKAGTVGDAGMREYYLNPDNLETADEQTLKMWERGIFTYAASHEEIERSLEILGLPADFSLQRLKNRYRYLCKQHHPDTEAGHRGKDTQEHTGGQTCPADFREIQHAYQVLMTLRQGEIE